jgi:hypothetical protein
MDITLTQSWRWKRTKTFQDKYLVYVSDISKSSIQKPA